MASDLKVFEVMIYSADANARAVSLLQRQLSRYGIRAGVTDLSRKNILDTNHYARFTLYFTGSVVDEEYIGGISRDRIDFTVISHFTGNDFCNEITRPSTGTLVERISSARKGELISAIGLRRETQASYDAIASQFTDVWFNHPPGEAIETFLKHLSRESMILDAGCGPGHHARFFKKAGFDPIGLDFSRSMLNIAAKKNDHIPFIQGDILSHKLPNLTFDGVWSAVALNHIPTEEVPLALENLVGTLKFNGFIGLNFQVGRPSEIVNLGYDHRFFEYPVDTSGMIFLLEALGVSVVSTHYSTTKTNIHGLSLEMYFATIVGQKRGLLDKENSIIKVID